MDARNEFEKWADQYFGKTDGAASDYFRYYRKQVAWDAWQAAVATTGAQPEAETFIRLIERHCDRSTQDGDYAFVAELVKKEGCWNVRNIRVERSDAAKDSGGS